MKLRSKALPHLCSDAQEDSRPRARRRGSRASAVPETDGIKLLTSSSQASSRAPRHTFRKRDHQPSASGSVPHYQQPGPARSACEVGACRQCRGHFVLVIHFFTYFNVHSFIQQTCIDHCLWPSTVLFPGIEARVTHLLSE